MMLKRSKLYLQGVDSPVLRTAYRFEYRGYDLAVAHSMNHPDMWNVFDLATGLAIWNGFERRTRKDALSCFMSDENLDRFTAYINFTRTDSYRFKSDTFYFAVRNAQNETGVY